MSIVDRFNTLHIFYIFTHKNYKILQPSTIVHFFSRNGSNCLKVNFQIFFRQIRSMGIHLNHKQEHRLVWLYYAIASVAVLILTTMCYVFQDFYSKYNITSLKLIQIVGSDVLQTSASIVISTSFTILLWNIHKRFVLLNSLLRFIYSSLHRKN